MRRTIKKWFWIWDFDKEEKWLNEMASKGLALVAVDYGKYTFDECVPGEYNIRLELLENIASHAESQQYIKFLEETGVEYVGNIIRWAYFRNKTDNGEFNLYSDGGSRIKHLNRILLLIGIVCIAITCFGVSNLFMYWANRGHMNLLVALLDVSVGLLMAYGFFSVFLKRKKLKREQNLFE